MRTWNFYRGVFASAAIYDLLLGGGFFLFYKSVFSTFNIQLPDLPAAYHLLAAFVFVQGIGYWFIYLNLKRNADMVKVGVVYRATYAALAIYYWAVGALPHPMFLLFGVFDLTFAMLFILYLRDYKTIIVRNA